MYTRMPASQLPSTSGETRSDGTRVSTGETGVLCYGPYVTCPPGSYTAGLFLRIEGRRRTDEVLRLEAALAPDTIVGRRTIPVARLTESYAKFMSVRFDVDTTRDRVEIRLHCPALAGIVVEEFVIFDDRS